MTRVECDICHQEIEPNDNKYYASIGLETPQGEEGHAMATREVCPNCMLLIKEYIETRILGDL